MKRVEIDELIGPLEDAKAIRTGLQMSKEVILRKRGV